MVVDGGDGDAILNCGLLFISMVFWEWARSENLFLKWRRLKFGNREFAFDGVPKYPGSLATAPE